MAGAGIGAVLPIAPGSARRSAPRSALLPALLPGHRPWLQGECAAPGPLGNVPCAETQRGTRQMIIDRRLLGCEQATDPCEAQR